MEQRLIQAVGGDSAALLIRVADFSELTGKLDRMMEALNEMQLALPLRRRKLSAATKRAHIGCILQRFEGKCPCCREVRIIGEDGRPLPPCNEEHFVNRHENALDKTWMVCQDCNQRKTTGKVAHSDVEALFRAYQVTLRKHLVEQNGSAPRQMIIVNSEKATAATRSKSLKGSARFSK